MVEKLDPTNQAHIDEFAKKHSAGFDDFESGVGEENKSSKESANNAEGWADLMAGFNTEFDEEIRALEKEKAGAKSAKEGEPFSNKIRKIKKLRADLFDIFNRPEFVKYRNKPANAKRLNEYARIVIKKSKDNNNGVGEFDLLNDLLTVANNRTSKAKSFIKILNTIATERKAQVAKEKDEEEAILKAQKAATEKEEEARRIEEERIAASKKSTAGGIKIDVESEESKKESNEISDAIDFFDKEILPLYEIKRDEFNWTGYNDEVVKYLKSQFLATASDFNFLDGDETKLKDAWDAVALKLEEKIKTKEDEILKSAQPEDQEKKEDSELTLENEKLKAAGADKKDIDYFRSLHKKDREDFLLSDEEELKLRIEKLKEIREKDEQKIIDRELIDLGDKLKISREKYVKKEDEIGIKISRLKKFFKNLVSIDKNYEIEKELEDYKKDYEQSLKDYLDTIVNTEKLSEDDTQGREIIYRYAKFGETLKMMSAKEDLKFEKSPRLEKFKKIFGAGTASFLDKYKELLGKPTKFIAKETGSGVLGFSGGIAVVGGAMALTANYIPGLRNVTLPLGIAVATKCFYERAESKTLVEKEKSLKEGIEVLEKRLDYIKDLGTKVDEAFKKELGLAVENIPEEVIKEMELVGVRFIKSLGKAVAVSAAFYQIGQIVGGFFNQDELPNNENQINQNDSNGIASSIEKTNNIEGVTTLPAAHHFGATIHPQTNFPIANEPIGGESFNTIVDEPSYQVEIEKSDLANPNNPVAENVLKPEATISSIDAENNPEINPDDVFGDKNTGERVADVPAVNAENFKGIVLDESGRGEIVANNGLGIKDTVAKLLVDNHEKLTEGKMGWNPDKYASVEEWADKRAIGIVGEFTGGSHDFDKISAGSEITINMNNPADIKIVDFTDGRELVNNEGITDTPTYDERIVFDEKSPEVNSEIDEIKKEVDAKEPVNKIEKEMASESGSVNENVAEKTTPQEIAEEKISENVAKKEALAAHSLGIDPKHYAEINHMSTAEFIAEAKRASSLIHGGGEDSMDVATSSLPVGNVFGNDEMANDKLGRVLGYLLRDGKIEDPNQSIAETLRSVKESDLISSIRTYEGIFGNISDNGAVVELNENEVYSEYISALIQAELKDMINSNASEGKVMQELAALRGVSMRDLSNNELLSAFKMATKNSVGNVEYKDSETLGKYIVKTIRTACETGKMDQLKESISKINISNMRQVA